MRTQTTISGNELLLSVIAIRLAVLVVVGWGLTLLPQQTRNRELGCAPPSQARDEAKLSAKLVGPRIVDAAFDDMIRHD
ncbi:hypothetical protein ABH991_004612 [Bradyrhizobium ottawaense]|uniref:Uncharacterized protein n=1 Tax=Bradyrhizobium ottawaense TaxID=931866 RepID=A0ABV4G2I4_9BRAD|nr:hypothetical protein [Bradyrhizobium ottawaense]MDA9414522.1 hypothetical protein [Bradyrhizobium sp. CCBAU 25360]MDA9481836.1 hypothetical protein [Bradyrhizobium sp. CCBAU 11445]PDT66513.1 hypothetical protein CO683_27735 [Bradyrhizobium ottawaense]BBO06880.1 hypothetical protein SG09_62300 [Bradyrhizobium ottawaense]